MLQSTRALLVLGSLTEMADTATENESITELGKLLSINHSPLLPNQI